MKNIHDLTKHYVELLSPILKEFREEMNKRNRLAFVQTHILTGEFEAGSISKRDFEEI